MVRQSGARLNPTAEIADAALRIVQRVPPGPITHTSGEAAILTAGSLVRRMESIRATPVGSNGIRSPIYALTVLTG